MKHNKKAKNWTISVEKNSKFHWWFPKSKDWKNIAGMKPEQLCHIAQVRKFKTKKSVFQTAENLTKKGFEVTLYHIHIHKGRTKLDIYEKNKLTNKFLAIYLKLP
jgi:hypothetical protein